MRIPVTSCSDRSVRTSHRTMRRRRQRTDHTPTSYSSFCLSRSFLILTFFRRVADVQHRLPKWPKWAEAALQGLSYWMGYRESLYRGHPVPEAAMVNEACNLIYANLTTGLQLLCEWRYRFLVPPKKTLC